MKERKKSEDTKKEPKAQPQPKPDEEKKPDDGMAKIVKQLEEILFSIKFYPVAVKEDAKDEARSRLIELYRTGDETVRQLVLYMIHENLAASAELKVMHTFEHFKMRKPNLEPAQLRMSVYRSMFNYHTSVEGLIEFIRILSSLDNDDAVKLLTYHYSNLCTMESETNHMLRNAIIDAMGDTSSTYALMTLMEYAKYTDNERTMQRILVSLTKWQDKLDNLGIPQEKKEKLRSSLKDVLTKEFGDSHYG